MSIVQMEALDFRYLLLEYYKKLKLNENELAVILMIDHLLGQKNTLITPDLLSLKMNLSTKDLDKIFVGLMQRGFLIFDTSKNIKISLKPLHKKLYEVFQESLAKEQMINSDENKSQEIQNIYQIFEKELSRSLSPMEFNIINEWVESGYTQEKIVNALKDCLAKGKKSLKSVDKVLLQMQARDDIEQSGYSAIKDDWKKNIEETLEIVKTKWIDD